MIFFSFLGNKKETDFTIRFLLLKLVFPLSKVGNCFWTLKQKKFKAKLKQRKLQPKEEHKFAEFWQKQY